ncbi:hypothetical protein BE08_35925 [Sorangium cellulosum]|uniref:Uncharacterized protein n=1 Tax=Sorangium cellulosum TaxID=56 RepID=A0A150PFI6_SORCE|nr:hypothetical protein BE08_35925 [Sorangium cellulosum]
MVNKPIGLTEEAVMDVEEDVVELQLELDDLDSVVGGVRRGPVCTNGGTYIKIGNKGNKR